MKKLIEKLRHWMIRKLGGFVAPPPSRRDVFNMAYKRPVTLRITRVITPRDLLRGENMQLAIRKMQEELLRAAILDHSVTCVRELPLAEGVEVEVSMKVVPHEWEAGA